MDRYGRLSHTIARSTDLSPQAKVIYAVLDMCRNPKTGQCNPKQTTLAELSGMSRKATNRAVRELKKGGILIILGTRRRPYYRLQNDLFTAPISPIDGTDEAQEDESISPTDGTNEAQEDEAISPTHGTNGPAAISPIHGINETVYNSAKESVDNSGIDSPLVPPVGQALVPSMGPVLVPPVGQRSRKAKGKEKEKSTPHTPHGGKPSLLVLKFMGKPDACMLQRLNVYFTYDRHVSEWQAEDRPAAHEVWQDTQEQYGREVTATVRSTPFTIREE